MSRALNQSETESDAKAEIESKAKTVTKAEVAAEGKAEVECALPTASETLSEDAPFPPRGALVESIVQTTIEETLIESAQATISIEQPITNSSLAPEIPADAKLVPAALTTESEIWQAGNVVEDRYEVRGVLGHGGMGTVYHVYDTIHNLDLAMKTPKIEGKDTEETERLEKLFINEALAWVGLGMHPNIVACCYVRRVAGRLRIFIEYVPGGTLTTWLAQTKVTDVATALDLGIQICWGVGWAHKRGLVHRDIKPDNVLLAWKTSAPAADEIRGEEELTIIPKVTDLGLVKVLEETSNQAQISTKV